MIFRMKAVDTLKKTKRKNCTREEKNMIKRENESNEDKDN